MRLRSSGRTLFDKTDNTWQGFSFLFAICFAATLVIWLAVDVPKGRQDAKRWAAKQRGTVYDVNLDEKVMTTVSEGHKRGNT